MALLSFKTLSVHIIARLATLTARQKPSWAGTCFLLQSWLGEIIIFDDSFRFASDDEDQLLGEWCKWYRILRRLLSQLSSISGRISLIFSNRLSLTNTVSNGQMVFLFGPVRLLLMILMTLFWSSVLLFRKDAPWYPHRVVSGLHVTDDIPPHVRCHPCSLSPGLCDTVWVSGTPLRIYPGASSVLRLRLRRYALKYCATSDNTRTWTSGRQSLV